MGLYSDFLTNDQRVIHKWTHYFPIYERHFAPFVNRTALCIEIGCGKGGSLQMWKRFLGPHAQIVGIDINPEAVAFREDQIEIRIGDQADSTFLRSLIDEFGTPDIVIDDGSHKMKDIVASFQALYPLCSKSGVYLVEDLHTCYWKEFGGGYKSSASFIELCKEFIDELHADHARGAVAATAFGASTLSMHFYESAIVFERGRHLRKFAPQIGQILESPK